MLVSTYYDSALYPWKETPIFRILYEHHATRLFLLLLFFFYSAVLVRLLRNSLSTKVGGAAAAAAAAKALAIRGRAEKNVGCMPVGLCHFRRGLSQLFRAFLLGAELVSPAIGENPFLLDHGAPLAMKIHGAHTASPLFLTRDIYWQVLCECFALTSTKRDFYSPPGEIANSISHHFDRQSISLIKSSYWRVRNFPLYIFAFIETTICQKRCNETCVG